MTSFSLRIIGDVTRLAIGVEDSFEVSIDANDDEIRALINLLDQWKAIKD